jgi:cell division protein ZapB
MDTSTFARLEQKIEELLGRLSALKSENVEMKSRLEAKDKELADLNELLSVQEAERNEVRQRIETLVNKLESI